MVEWKKILLEGDGRRGIGCSYDNPNGSINSGERVFIPVPYGATIIGYYIESLRGESGSIELDIWKKNGEKPVITDSILTSPLLLDGSDFFYSIDLTNFTTTSIDEVDCLCFYVNKNSNLTGFAISLIVTKD